MEARAQSALVCIPAVTDIGAVQQPLFRDLHFTMLALDLGGSQSSVLVDMNGHVDVPAAS